MGDPDLNDDGVVDILDVSLASSCLGEDPSVNQQCAVADVNGDGVIDLADVDFVVEHFGETGFPVADTTAPEIEILAPENLAGFNATSVTVEGTVDDPDATVDVNGSPALVGGTPSSFLTDVELEEGSNLITVTATDLSGNVATASITVFVDTQPPMVTIDSPPDGLVTTSNLISVAGMINDIVVGTVNGDQAEVTVNGVPATVANRSYLAEDVPLVAGDNLIVAQGVDTAGNVATASILVTFEEVMDEPTIQAVSGNNQTGPIGSLLPDPLVVQLLDGAGVPVPNETVIFRVLENNGTLSENGTADARALMVTSDANGEAQVDWTLGTRSGAGNNVAEATAVGFAGMASFTAIGLPGPSAAIVVDGGVMQTGVVGEPLPRPFSAVVIDAGNNRLSGVPVTFEVIAGGGSFAGAPSTTVETDSDGRALAVLTLGPGEGFDNNVARADFAGNTGAPASFTASGKVAGDAADTQLSGVVLDNADQPIPGVTLHIAGTGLFTQADEEGQFLLSNVPVGAVHLEVDGSTAARPGVWPSLEFELVTVSGRNNTLGMPIFLLPLDVGSELCVDETSGGTLTLPEVPGFALMIEPGSSTFPDGSRQGCVSVTVVHNDKVPMVPNFGQQPTFIVTIQPSGVLFDPPAPLTIPNSDGLAPGEVTEMYSFDHDLGQFVSIGTGTVSEDGTVIESDPGVGIIKGGWHCGGNPTSIGTCEHECDDGNDCTDDMLVGDSCQHTDKADGTRCRDADPDFEHKGVNITIDASCRGKCKSGACSEKSDEGFNVQDIKNGLTGALDKVFDSCVGEPLRTDMQDDLKDKGTRLVCKPDSAAANPGSDCANAPGWKPGNNDINMFAHAKNCGALSHTIIHELVHAAANYFPEDKPEGCVEACFPGASFGGDASKCK